MKNFIPHKSTALELVKGINVLAGPHNSGKSAVISAILLLAELPVKDGDYMVRHGRVGNKRICGNKQKKENSHNYAKWG